MDKRALKADILLLIVSCVWGFGFVAQRTGMDYLGPFSYNGVRFILGSLSLLPLIWWRKSRGTSLAPGASAGRQAVYACLAGTCLFVAVILQQFGLMFTTVGNAGFITGLYVVLVPVFGILFFRRKTGLPTWIGAGLTLLGLYFLSSTGGIGSINPGDVITVVSAVFWAFHVLLIDRLVRKMDPIVLSSGQFFWCGLLALAAAFTVEGRISGIVSLINPSQPGLLQWRSLPELGGAWLSGELPQSFINDAAVPVLYGGLGSVGVAYTLQAVAQRDAPPAHACIILCLEGAFAALGGALLLREPVTPQTFLGAALMLSGMLATQWDVLASGRNGKSTLDKN
jgi:drug/metabolite transporter (DMT)-like permease